MAIPYEGGSSTGTTTTQTPTNWWDTTTTTKPGTWTGYGPQGQGTYYLDGPNGSPGTYIGPTTKGGNSDGGSTSYNTYMTGQLGANRYTTYTDSSGNLWQIDNLDGSQSIIQKAPSNANPADRNNDGLDDSTNMALGVYADNTSSSGYYYPSASGQLIPVLPNGAPYTGPDLYPDPPPAAAPRPGTWTGYGPKGQGTYYLDGPNGTPGTFIGTTQAPPKATTTGGGFTSGGSSGGGGSSGPTRDYAGEQAAALAAQAQRDAENNAFEAAQAELNRTFQMELANANNAADQAIAEMNYALGLKRLGLDEKRFGVDAAETFGRLASSTDPLAFAAFLHAGGGNIMNALSTGADALSPAALLPAARALQAMRGLGSGGGGGVPGGFSGGRTGFPPSGTRPGDGLPAGGGAANPTPLDPGVQSPATPPAGTPFAARIGNQNAPGTGTEYQSPTSPGINMSINPQTGMTTGSGYVKPDAFGISNGGFTFEGGANQTVPFGFEGNAADLYAAQQYMLQQQDALYNANKAAGGIGGTQYPTVPPPPEPVPGVWGTGSTTSVASGGPDPSSMTAAPPGGAEMVNGQWVQNPAPYTATIPMYAHGTMRGLSRYAGGTINPYTGYNSLGQTAAQAAGEPMFAGNAAMNPAAGMGIPDATHYLAADNSFLSSPQAYLEYMNKRHDNPEAGAYYTNQLNQWGRKVGEGNWAQRRAIADSGIFFNPASSKWELPGQPSLGDAPQAGYSAGDWAQIQKNPALTARLLANNAQQGIQYAPAPAPQAYANAAPQAAFQPAPLPANLGFVNDPMMVTGDAPATNPAAGGAKPEIIVNPTNAPIGVIPHNETRSMLGQTATTGGSTRQQRPWLTRPTMRGLQRYAEGTRPYDQYLSDGGAQAYAVGGTREAPVYEYLAVNDPTAVGGTAPVYESPRVQPPAPATDPARSTPLTDSGNTGTSISSPALNPPSGMPTAAPEPSPSVWPHPTWPTAPSTTPTLGPRPTTGIPWDPNNPELLPGNEWVYTGPWAQQVGWQPPPGPGYGYEQRPIGGTSTKQPPTPASPIGANVPGHGGYGVNPLTDAQLGVTPGDIPTMEEVLGLRQGTQVPNIDWNNIAFWDENPVIRDMYFSGLQGLKGLPEAGTRWEADRLRMRGLSGSGLALGV